MSDTNRRSVPNFLYIGPSKAGSTWIFEALRLHPQVFLSKAKELHYFDIYYSLGPDWYFEHFAEAQPQHLVVGEISHNYLYSEQACSRIASDLTDVRLMVCVREPVERAFSDYLYMRRQGYVGECFSEAIEQCPAIVEQSLYASNLIRYRNTFGKQALVLTTFDALKTDPEAYYLALCKTIGIQEMVPAGFPTGAVLAAAEPRSRVVARAAKATAMYLRKRGAAEVITRIKSQKWVQSALYRPFRTCERPTLDPAIRDRLRRYFQEDVWLLDREFLPGIARMWGY